VAATTSLVSSMEGSLSGKSGAGAAKGGKGAKGAGKQLVRCMHVHVHTCLCVRVCVCACVSVYVHVFWACCVCSLGRGYVGEDQSKELFTCPVMTATNINLACYRVGQNRIYMHHT
jgi:hypothetical protein